MSVFRKNANVPARVLNNIINAGAVVAGELLVAPVSFITNGYSSSISITSAADISAINFTITGTFNGNNIVEILAGANANTVSSVNVFDNITSIVSSGAAAQAYSIGSNNNIAVLLNITYPGNLNNILNISNDRNIYANNMNNINSMITSRTAAGAWAGPNVIMYGLSNSSNIAALTVANLTYATRPNNFYAINDPAAGVTQAQLNRGFITNTVYPFTSIIVCFLNSVNTTPSFVEITQS